MRKPMWVGVVLAVLCAAPMSASAGVLVEASVGSGMMVKPRVERVPSNVMIAPGYALADILALQLGLVADLGDAQNSEFDIQLRPQIKIDPPIIPLHARIILAVQNLLGEGDTVIAYGGALGISFSLAGLGGFAEVGVLPSSVADQTITVVEGRVGIMASF